MTEGKRIEYRPTARELFDIEQMTVSIDARKQFSQTTGIPLEGAEEEIRARIEIARQINSHPHIILRDPLGAAHKRFYLEDLETHGIFVVKRLKGKKASRVAAFLKVDPESFS